MTAAWSRRQQVQARMLLVRNNAPTMAACQRDRQRNRRVTRAARGWGGGEEKERLGKGMWREGGGRGEKMEQGAHTSARTHKQIQTHTNTHNLTNGRPHTPERCGESARLLPVEQ